MSNGFFFSENWLKANTAITQNVDYEDIRPFIEPAQDQLIKVRIGKSLYDRLVEAIVNGDWNNDELELLKLVRPAAAYYTVYLALPFLQTKIKNKGLVKGTDQYIQTISKDDMLSLRQEVLQMSNYYMARVEEWLCNYSYLYPQYQDPNPLNDKNYAMPYDFGGFLGYKGYPYGMNTDVDLILKMINYKKY
jgi:hypothetical protein